MTKIFQGCKLRIKMRDENIYEGILYKGDSIKLTITLTKVQTIDKKLQYDQTVPLCEDITVNVKDIIHVVTLCEMNNSIHSIIDQKAIIGSLLLFDKYQSSTEDDDYTLNATKQIREDIAMIDCLNEESTKSKTVMPCLSSVIELLDFSENKPKSRLSIDSKTNQSTPKSCEIKVQKKKDSLLQNMDKLKRLFYCDFCHELLNNPIILPCGQAVCLKDLIPLASTAQKKCLFCNKTHLKYEHGVNQIIIELMKLGLHELNFDDITKLVETKRLKHANKIKPDLIKESSVISFTMNLDQLIKPREQSKMKGYFGIVNTTCFNILLQTLYFTSEYRRFAKKINSDHVIMNSNHDIVFNNLKHFELVLLNNGISDSFEFGHLNKFMKLYAFKPCQNETTEVLEYIEPKIDGIIPRFFQGELMLKNDGEQAIQYIYGIHMNVRDNKDIYESLRKFTWNEHGSLVFKTMPPIIHFSLEGSNLNTFDFHEHVDLAEFMLERIGTKYTLFSVLIDGSDFNGHSEFVNPELNDKWFKYNRDVLQTSSFLMLKETAKSYSNLIYMLVYVKDSSKVQVLAELKN